ncbi:MAG: RNA 2'-phosphotransferase [Thermoplasmata archaeon]|jgi:putative RNA 2'-phosphotransferase|nr:RNA 2'-phosphotransferase [Thermoplasmata archaeon]
MIRECEDHGYYRSERCPVCGEEGKFIMSDFEVEKIGRSLAGMLRHGKYGLKMDSQGYVSTRDVLDKIKELNPRMKWLRIRHLEALVDTDPKGRYCISGGKIRATYGHTIQLDIRLDCENIPEELFYPTNEEEVEGLLENGIVPVDRSMVHLSRTFGDAMRAGLVHTEDPIILGIDTDMCMDMGCDIGKAARTVYLCHSVPAEAIFVADPDEYGTDEGSDE